MMFSCGCLALLVFIPSTFSTNAGVKVKLTEKGLEYGRQLGMAAVQQKLKTLKIPDMSGTAKVPVVGKVSYSLSSMQIVDVGLPESAVSLVPGSGVRMSIGNAFINLHGNWRVKYLKIIKDSGSFDLNVKGLTISTTISVKSDETGRPAVSSLNCAATVGSTTIKFHHGASWLYNLFKNSIDKILRNTMQKQICPLVDDAISDMNPHLKTLNVVAQVDKYAEIDYSMVSSPTISNASVDLSLKGEFYNIGQHVEPPFSPAVFNLPPQVNNMLYIGMSAFTANSAAFVYNKAGALSLYVTDDMIPKSSPIRLNTKTFGTFVPEIARRFPGLMMKLLVKPVKDPSITFQTNNATVQVVGTVTAYAIQPNATLSPLFVLKLDTSISARVSVSEMKLVGNLSLNEMNITLETSYVGEFQIKTLDTFLHMIVKVIVIPKVNAELAKGYPLPKLGKMTMVNTQLQLLQDYMLIGTDVQFNGVSGNSHSFLHSSP